MADPKTSVSDYQRGRSAAFKEVIEQGMAIYKNEQKGMLDLTYPARYVRGL